MEEDDEYTITVVIPPNRWSWTQLGAMAAYFAATVAENAGQLLTQVGHMANAHAAYHRDRADMAEQGAMEIEMLTGAGEQ